MNSMRINLPTVIGKRDVFFTKIPATEYLFDDKPVAVIAPETLRFTTTNSCLQHENYLQTVCQVNNQSGQSTHARRALAVIINMAHPDLTGTHVKYNPAMSEFTYMCNHDVDFFLHQ